MCCARSKGQRLDTNERIFNVVFLILDIFRFCWICCDTLLVFGFVHRTLFNKIRLAQKQDDVFVIILKFGIETRPFTRSSQF